MVREERRCDVVILGASMAGSCLARQLKLRHPTLDIVVVDRKTTFGPWVGESTLEVFWDYAVRHLDLGPYLDKHHLYKHGLRFFFDSETHDLRIDQLSEFGRTWYHRVPAHQLSRARFDRDLCEMNRAAGIDVRLGVAVYDLDLDRHEGHAAVTSEGTFRCRWLVDAGGFDAPLGRKLGMLRSVSDRHPVSSYWGRFKGVAELDLAGDQAWRARVNHTSRSLSTNHFMYEGYWIWMIPVDAETTSIGVTVRRDVRPDIRPTHAGQLLTFLRSHACFEQLLKSAEIQDFDARAALPRYVEQAYSEDGWFITGMASAFIEPLLSPGCAHLSDSNRMIGDLIATDMAGDAPALREKARAYNVYTRAWFEAVLMQIQGLYSGLFDVHVAFFEPAIMNYFGLILPTSMAERWGYQAGSPASMAPLEQLVQAAVQRVAGNASILGKLRARALELEAYLREHGVAYENNRGRFFDSEAPDFVLHQTATQGRELGPVEAQRIMDAMYEFCLAYALKRMAQVHGMACDPEDLREAVEALEQSGGSLAQGLAMLAAAERPEVALAGK